MTGSEKRERLEEGQGTVRQGGRSREPRDLDSCDPRGVWGLGLDGRLCSRSADRERDLVGTLDKSGGRVR